MNLKSAFLLLPLLLATETLAVKTRATTTSELEQGERDLMGGTQWKGYKSSKPTNGRGSKTGTKKDSNVEYLELTVLNDAFQQVRIRRFY